MFGVATWKVEPTKTFSTASVNMDRFLLAETEREEREILVQDLVHVHHLRKQTTRIYIFYAVINCSSLYKLKFSCR